MKLLVGVCVIAFFILWVQIITQYIKVKRHYRKWTKESQKRQAQIDAHIESKKYVRL